MVAVARAMSMGPRVLLLDELSFGLSPVLVARLLAILRELATSTGLGVLLVEQHVRQALQVADRAYVLKQGRIAAHGTAAAMLADRSVVEAGYLGSSAAESSSGPPLAQEATG